MIDTIFSLGSVFPFSFLIYSWSERELARHESRVGKDIALPAFIWQTWIDTLLEVKVRKSIWHWVLFTFQCSLPFVCGIRFEYLVFPWLALVGFTLVASESGAGKVFERIDSDQKQVSFAISSAVALLCLLGAFALSGNADLGAAMWSPLHLFFVIPFQIAGMILFQEHPFRGFLEKASWLESVRFYGWCMVTTRVFLGGGEYFFDTNLKASALFMGSRVLAVYFPRMRQKDLLKIGIMYFLPLTGALWLMVMLVMALTAGGGVDG